MPQPDKEWDPGGTIEIYEISNNKERFLTMPYTTNLWLLLMTQK